MSSLKKDRKFKETANLRLLFLIKGGGLFFLKIIATWLTFVISVLLARILGAKEYGKYIYVIAWFRILEVPVIFGLDRVLISNISVYLTQSSWNLMRGILRRTNQIVIVTSISIIILATIIMEFFLRPQDYIIQLIFLFAFLSLPLRGLIVLRQSTLQGLDRVVWGQLPETVIQPITFIILIALSWKVKELKLSALWAMGLRTISIGITFIISSYLLQKFIPDVVKRVNAIYKTIQWIYEALPLVLISGLMIINSNADILMLGAIKGAEFTGIYSVASRGASLVTFFLTAINTAIAPTIASLYTKRDIGNIQQIVTKSARLVFILSFPVASVLMLFSQNFLSFFGHEFIYGKTTLLILTLGQLINVAAGPVGTILVMTGHQGDAARGIAVSSMLNIILNALLIPSWGIEGAALATATSIIIWNILLVFLVYKRLRIHTTILAI